MRLVPLFLSICAVGSTAFAQDFPLTIETKFGPATIPQKPVRVATVDFSGADDLLALGIQPVALRHWYGDHPRAVWPWADALLQGEPAILKGELNYEQIAATHPDVILALWSGIDERQFEKLSLIAPVVAVPPGVGDYALPWRDRARIAAQAVGKSAEAEAQIDAITTRLSAIAEAHPEWRGRVASVAFNWNGTPGAYTSADVRPQLMAELGFRNPAAVEALAISENGYSANFSPEDLSPIEGDLIIWVGTDNAYESVLSLPTRPFLTAVSEGREVFTDTDLGSALSHSSLLSLPYAIDRLVPMIEAAMDGDPQTVVPDGISAKVFSD